MKQKLTIVTGNKLKFKELSAALSEYFDCDQESIGIHEIQGSPDMVFTYKMNACFRKFNKPVLVDDTSFHLSSLNGFPGPYIKDFLTAFKSWQIGQRFDGDRVKIVCRIGICFGANDFVFGMGELDGTITGSSLRNDLGTEFDLIVTPDGKDKLMIDYSTEEKNQFSHRGKAVQDVLQKLKEREEKIALKA